MRIAGAAGRSTRRHKRRMELVQFCHKTRNSQQQVRI
jgi:hypothetical protein